MILWRPWTPPQIVLLTRLLSLDSRHYQSVGTFVQDRKALLLRFRVLSYVCGYV